MYKPGFLVFFPGVFSSGVSSGKQQLQIIPLVPDNSYLLGLSNSLVISCEGDSFEVRRVGQEAAQAVRSSMAVPTACSGVAGISHTGLNGAFPCLRDFYAVLCLITFLWQWVSLLKSYLHVNELQS